MKAILREGGNVYHSRCTMSQNAKNHAILLLQMQASFTTQNQEFKYGLCLILMYKEIKYKSFNAPLLSIGRKSQMQMQKTRSNKGFQTKHALKAMRTKRKQVEKPVLTRTQSNIQQLDNHSLSTRRCREESKKRQREREITQIVPTKQAARKGNFTFLKKFQAPINTIRGDKHQIST
jgi:hypothetical protein